jgi:DNA modification methylase
LKDNGVLFCFVDRHNLIQSISYLQDFGYLLIRDIVWLRKKKNRTINLKKLIDYHEIILWMKKNEYPVLCNLTEYDKDVWEIETKDNSLPEYLIEKIVGMSTDPNYVISEVCSDGEITVVKEVVERNKRVYGGVKQIKTRQP